jgi:hypothetical protein
MPTVGRISKAEPQPFAAPNVLESQQENTGVNPLQTIRTEYPRYVAVGPQ